MNPRKEVWAEDNVLDAETNLIERDPKPVLTRSQSSGLSGYLANNVEAMIAFSEQTDRLGIAIEKVRRFIFKIALPGDWVRFDDTIDLSAAGAERIAAALGLQFVNWQEVKETGTDKYGEWFAWEFTCTIKQGERMIENCRGRASSRDKFHGYAHQAWKDVADVNEYNVKTAARRGAMKEGVKVFLGLRRLSVADAEAMGLDSKAIETARGHSFESNKTYDMTSDDTRKEHRKIARIYDVDEEKRGSKTIYKVTIEDGTSYDTFSKSLKDEAEKLGAAQEVVCLIYTVNKYGNRLERISEVDQAEVKS